jgi:hypothetical protein
LLGLQKLTGRNKLPSKDHQLEKYNLRSFKFIRFRQTRPPILLFIPGIWGLVSLDPLFNGNSPSGLFVVGKYSWDAGSVGEQDTR